ncbi:MAG: nitrogenase cofactor biosynthesis protein NifB [Planctomycetaceae bacterium]|jgi:nitrogen fixation protein NifB|nr:nitrogenase cofactor biosynthesis protein NifB [Planctomycetaceae bacterium]
MFSNHPCFNESVRHRVGRVHLPVASRCNIQCNYCNRKYDCVNESRPGVSSVIFDPFQALCYLDSVFASLSDISVIGIAGPGDPFANSAETLRTMELVGKKYPDKILCVATNGLGLCECIDRVSELNISHVTITMNAIDPEVGAKIYAWVRLGNRVYRGVEGAKILFERQVESIRALKSRGIVVKVNTVVIPSVNYDHVLEVSRFCGGLGVDVQNCIPLVRVEGTVFAECEEPDVAAMADLRKNAGRYIPQMEHCARCRSDAVGMLGNDNGFEINRLLREAMIIRPTVERPNVAVATMEGLFVNCHLGEADVLCVFGKRGDKIVLLEQRPVPQRGLGDLRWRKLAEGFSDCVAVLVSGCGESPRRVLGECGLRVVELEGLISEAVPCMFAGKEIPKVLLRKAGVCGTGGCGSSGCKGSGYGCG